MIDRTKQNVAGNENKIQQAINGYRSKNFASLRKAADAFEVPYSTMRARINGRTSRSDARESQQNLSNAEEHTLVRWITHLTRTGYPASPKLVIQMAEEVRRGRVHLSRTITLTFRPIGYSWLERFKGRHSELGGIWTRQIEGARFYAANYDGVRQ